MKVQESSGGEGRRRRRAKLNIGPILIHLEKVRWREPTDRATAAAIGIPAGTYSELKSGRRSPTFAQLALLCRYFDVHLRTFFPAESKLFVRERDGLRWQVRTGLERDLERTIRDATELTLQGESPRAIAEHLGSSDPEALLRLAASIPTKTRAGLGMGLVRLVLSPDAGEIEDPALAAELAQALAAVAPPGRQGPSRVHVRVVRNFAHPDFPRDPIVPFLAARVAHGIVARFLEDDPQTFTLGIAGGIHVASFVRSIGSDSSPFPVGGDRRFVLVPLTLEPFHDHRFDLADALAGEFQSRAAMLLGPLRVHAPSFKPFGYLEEGRIGQIETDSMRTVRENYLLLDVAIFGCGDQSDDGWIEWARKMAGEGFDPPPPTDVCLNPISERGEPIPLPKHDGHRRVPIGATIDHIRSLAKKDKLALLLASGATKGVPITLVVRAGCANAVVCDQAAARAALASLVEGRAGG